MKILFYKYNEISKLRNEYNSLCNGLCIPIDLKFRNSLSKEELIEQINYIRGFTETMILPGVSQ